MRTVTASIGALLLACATSAWSQEPRADPWAPVRMFVGDWEGTAAGKAGDGTVKRRYEFVLGERFLHEKNTSTYPPQERNKKGEVHEHWSFTSYDKARKALVLRQFHVEGFVNQFSMSAEKSAPTKLVFESDGFENFSHKWRARETYEIAGPDEFTETFELAAPDKPFEVYSTNRFRRVRP
jgi:hypothetical protein